MATRGWLIILTCAALAMSVVPACAQYPTPEAVGMNYTITGGAVILANGNMRETSFPMIGIAWFDAAGPEFGENAVMGLSADWTGIERNDGETVNVVPLLFNYRQYGIISNWRVSMTLGVGLLALTDSIPEMDLDDGANFGWTAGLGVDLTNSLGFQARFIGGSNPGEDGMTSIQLGYRF